MTSGKAILLASVVIGVAIVAAAFVWRGPAPSPAPVAVAPAPSPAPSSDAPGRYQIVKVENGVSWRLDTVTGEMTACRMDGDRMLCARSTEATEMPKVSAEELEKRRQAEREARKEEKTAMFDRFLSIFKWMMDLARDAEEAEPSPAPAPVPDDGSPRRL